MMMRRLFSALLIMLVTSGLLSACTKPAAKPTVGRQGGTFRYFSGEPVSIDPLNSQESEGLEITKQLFDGLVDYDPVTMKTVPAVARAWKANVSNNVFTFYLRKGVRFHNGREVTAPDFKWSWERVVRKGSGSDIAYHFAPIKGFEKLAAGKSKGLVGVRAVDKYTLEVTLAYPYAEFPTILGHPVFSPVPREVIRRDPKGFAEAPVGNGPFRMAGKWRHGRAINIRRFERYYGQKAHLDSVLFQIFDSEQAGFIAFKAGALDYSPIPTGQVAASRTEYGKRALVGKAQLVVSMFGFNLNNRTLGESVALRQAINYAIDRQAIAKIVFEGSRVPANKMVPDILLAGGGERYKKDPGRSRLLLSRAGYGKKKQVNLRITYATGTGFDEVAQLIQQDLGDVGITVKLEGLEQGAFIDAMRGGKLQLFAFNWGADYPTADALLYPLLYSKSQDNLTHYASKNVDNWLLGARAASAGSERSQLYSKISDKTISDAPVAPLTFYSSRLVYGRNVRGFMRTGLDDTPLDKVWLVSQ